MGEVKVALGGRCCGSIAAGGTGGVGCDSESGLWDQQVRCIGQRGQGEDVPGHEDGELGAKSRGQDLEGLEVDGRAAGRVPRARVDREPVDVAAVLVADDGRDEVHCFPEIFVHADLDANAAPETFAFYAAGMAEVYRPPVPREPPPRRDDHVPHQLPALHERGAEDLGAGPALRTPAVEVDAVDKGGGEGGGALEFQGHVGAELGDGRDLLLLLRCGGGYG